MTIPYRDACDRFVCGHASRNERAVLSPNSLEQGTPGDVAVEKDDARSLHGPNVCPGRSPLPPHEDGLSCGGRRTDVDWTRPGGRASTATASTPLEHHGGTTPNESPNLRRIDTGGRFLESTTVRGEELPSEVERPRPHRKTTFRHSSPHDARRRNIRRRPARSLRHGPIMPFCRGRSASATRISELHRRPNGLNTRRDSTAITPAPHVESLGRP